MISNDSRSIKDIIDNYEESVSIINRIDKYSSISLLSPWVSVSPQKAEKLDHAAIYSVWENLKIRKLFDVIVAPNDPYYPNKNEFTIFYNYFTEGHSKTKSIKLEFKWEEIFGLRTIPPIIGNPTSCPQEELERQSVSAYAEEITKAIDNFFIKKFLKFIEGKIYTTLGYIRDGPNLLKAVENVFYEATYNKYNNLGVFLTSPLNKHELEALASFSRYEYGWLNNIEIIESPAVSDKYIYILPDNKCEELNNLICFKNLVAVNMANTCLVTQWDGGVINYSKIGRIKVRG
jgi:hypothetical protein